MLQRKRHIKIELCVKLSDLRLVHVGRVVQNMRSALSLASHANGHYVKANNEIFTTRARVVVRTSNMKISRRGLDWQTTSKNCTEKHVARAARLFFLIQPIK